MKRVAKIFWVLFFICSAINILSLATGHGEIGVYARPFLVPLMAVALFIELTSQKNAKSIVISFGCKDKFHLLCTFIMYTAGDIFMMSECDDCFVQGMIFFLMGHLSYILFFFRMIPEIRTRKFVIYAATLLIPAVLIPFTLDLNLPLIFTVAGYSYTLLIMALTGYATLIHSDSFDKLDDDDDPDSWNESDALHRAGSYMLYGALLFIVFHFIIAIKHFLGFDFKYDEAIMMVAYIAAHVRMAKAVLGLQSRFCMFMNIRKK